MGMVERCPVEIQQNGEEFDWLFDFYCSLKPKSVVEIGSYRGGTLWCWIQGAQSKTKIVSIDLPIVNSDRVIVWNEWAKDKDVELTIITESSADRKVIEKTKELAEPIDFIFIDGNHRYEGCRADFDNYWPMVRDGGIMALHDIAGGDVHESSCRVYKLWAEIKQMGFKTEEKIIKHGTGIVWKS